MNKKILFINHQISFSLRHKRLVKNWIAFVIEKEKKILGDITYIFCNDNYLLEINQKHLNADYLTDVITFDYTENNTISGDIIISIDRVKENAKYYKVVQQNELLRVMIHGVLHLCGYKDKTEREQEKMRKKEDFYLSKIYPTV